MGESRIQQHKTETVTTNYEVRRYNTPPGENWLKQLPITSNEI